MADLDNLGTLIVEGKSDWLIGGEKEEPNYPNNCVDRAFTGVTLFDTVKF